MHSLPVPIRSNANFTLDTAYPFYASCYLRDQLQCFYRIGSTINDNLSVIGLYLDSSTVGCRIIGQCGPDSATQAEVFKNFLIFRGRHKLLLFRYAGNSCTGTLRTDFIQIQNQIIETGVLPVNIEEQLGPPLDYLAPLGYLIIYLELEDSENLDESLEKVVAITEARELGIYQSFILFSRGRVHELRGEYDLAIQRYAMVLDMEPTNKNMHFYIIIILYGHLK